MKTGYLLAVVALVAFAAGALAAESGGNTMEGVEKVLVLEPSPGNPRNSEGDFVRLRDGRILFAYTRFTGSASDYGAADIASRYSDDGGKTWSDRDEILVPNEGAVNTMSVSMLRLKSGRIALFYLVKESHGSCKPYLRYSSDEAQTWSERIACIDVPGYFVVNNDRLVQLNTGRLLFPTAQHPVADGEIRHRGTALCYLSDDEGLTWRASDSRLEAPADSKSGLQEPGVVELADARLMMLSRTDQGCQYRSFSKDAGITWSPAEPSDLLSPVSPATFERIPKTRDLLITWNNHDGVAEELRGKRTPFTLAISKDEGKTWEHVRNIEDDPNGWYCYTAMEFVGDHVLLGHCAGDRRTGGLNTTQIVRIAIDALYK